MLGVGHPTAVPFWSRSFPMPTRLTSHEILNPDGVKAWRADGPTGGRCLWEMHDVWRWDETKNTGVVLRENYFVQDPMTGKKVEYPSRFSEMIDMLTVDPLQIDWYTEFYYPFLQRWANRVHAASPQHKLLFVEAIPNEASRFSFPRVHSCTDCRNSSAPPPGPPNDGSLTWFIVPIGMTVLSVTLVLRCESLTAESQV
jgi:hypothetical protein